MKSKLEKYGLKFNKSKNLWDEGIPLGNSKLGCLIYGEGPINFSLDRIDLWDEQKDERLNTKNFNYETFLKYSTGDEFLWKQKSKMFDLCPRRCYPSKISACRLMFDIGGKYKNIKSNLDIYNGLANVLAETVQLESFISAVKNVGVIKIYGEYSIKIHIPKYISNNGEDNNNSQKNGMVSINDSLDYPKTKIIKDGKFTFFKQETKTKYNYAVVVLEKKLDNVTEIYYTVTTSDDATDCVEYGKTELEQLSAIGYDALLQEHTEWWDKYWSKSSIDLNDDDFEKTYYRSLYFLASTSRVGGYPMPLQGVWTADNDELPPWKGDYHHDTNTQMSYWGYGKANRMAQGKVFVDYIWSLRDEFKKFAKKFFNVDGYIIPACSSLKGQFMGGWSQYSLSPTMSIWVAKAFDDYYFYSGDKVFLAEKAYPFFVNVERAIKSLFAEVNGKYYLPLSSSPEIFEEKSENFRIGNTNFDQALILYLYKTLIRFGEMLGKDVKEYKSTFSKLDNIYVSKDKIIMLSQRRKLPISHRHFSHLMCVYPLNLLKNISENNREIIYNSILEIEQLGTGWWVGFSFPWCATLYTKLYNGNAAYEKLRTFNIAFLSDNGFHLNGDFKHFGVSQWHYRPFTLEALFAYVDAIQEMLIQDDKGYIELFPAVPEKWKNLNFNNFRTENGVLVSARLDNGFVTNLELISDKETIVKIKLNNNISCITAGNDVFVNNGFAIIKMAKDDKVVFKC